MTIAMYCRFGEFRRTGRFSSYVPPGGSPDQEFDAASPLFDTLFRVVEALENFLAAFRSELFSTRDSVFYDLGNIVYPVGSLVTDSLLKVIEPFRSIPLQAF